MQYAIILHERTILSLLMSTKGLQWEIEILLNYGPIFKGTHW